MSSLNNFELLEIDPYGHTTRIGTYDDLLQACDEVQVCDALPTVVVAAIVAGDPDDRLVLDNGPFDFTARATLVGFSAVDGCELAPGDLSLCTIRAAKWYFGEWWQRGILELSQRR